MFPCRQVSSQSTKIHWCRSSEEACKCKTLPPKKYPPTCLIIVGYMDVLKLTVQLLQAEFQPLNETKIQVIALGHQEAASMWNGWNTYYKREFWLRLTSILCGPRSKGTLCLSRTSRRGCRILNSVLQQTCHLLPHPRCRWGCICTCDGRGSCSCSTTCLKHTFVYCGSTLSSGFGTGLNLPWRILTSSIESVFYI